jgi:RHS repeat-associated protein
MNRMSSQRSHALACLALVSALPATAQTLPAPPVSPTPVTGYEYDASGNPTKTTQAPGSLGLSTSTNYDGLSRATTITDPANGAIQLEYDGQDRLTKVTDARALITQYPRNGLGDATRLISPDTGTASHTYDAAGNLTARTDSRSVRSSYTYDALNRPTSVVHSKSGATSEAHTWVYDQTGAGYAHGVGRLTSTTHPAGSTQYQYDAQGRLTSDTQRIHAATGANAVQIERTVSYTYDARGNITSLTYPSGRRLSIGYDAAGRASTLSLAKDASGQGSALISNIQWEPFGAPRSWEWHMATGVQAQSWSYDSSARLTRYRLGSHIRDLSYDEADRISAYTHYNASTAAPQTSLDQSFGYDALSRLSSVTAGTSSWTIGYDATGNRTSVTLNAVASSYTTPATSNRLTATTNPTRTITHDAAGNITRITGATASAYTSTYNLAGRLSTLTKSGVTASYAYDNDGRRIRKFISAGTGAGAASTVLFAYDQNDQLLGEYDSTGTPIREYVWLGNTPVAIFTPDTVATNPPLVYYVNTDHLNTPRVVFDTANRVRWRWLAEPFGTTVPETNPSNLGSFTQNLRFPGQYADQESGLFYNHHRDYDPAIGRYVQSDPIGLAGGINTFSYVGGNPLSLIDPDGLNPRFGRQAENMPLGPGAGGGWFPLPRWNPKPGDFKPAYKANPAHDPKSPLYNPKKTPEPKDCSDVYKRAVPDDPVDARHWWGKSGDGNYYRFHNSNDGTAHFSASFSPTDSLVPRYVRERLGAP